MDNDIQTRLEALERWVREQERKALWIEHKQLQGLFKKLDEAGIVFTATSGDRPLCPLPDHQEVTLSSSH